MSQSCFESIINLQNPGGESIAISPLDSNLRVRIRFTEGHLYQDTKKIKGVIENNKFLSAGVFSPSCFIDVCSDDTNLLDGAEGVFEDREFWTRAYRTDISREVNGVTEYLVPAIIDIEGNAWFVETGTLCSDIGSITISDTPISVVSDNTFTSNKDALIGIKFARLIRISYEEYEIVHQIYGEFPFPSLSRTFPGYVLNYTAEDQKVDLIELCLSLINLIHADFIPESKDLIYLFNKEIYPELKKIINRNLSQLSTLVDLTSTSKRRGSIPRYLTTYITYPKLYLNDADYQKEKLRIFEEGCFSEDTSTCSVFVVVDNLLLTSREVDNEGIAWYLYLLTLYETLYNDTTYQVVREQITFYLLNQIDPVYNLPYQGWTHDEVLSNSTLIGNKLLRVATSYIAAFSLLYDLTNNSLLLEKAWLIWEGCLKYYYNHQTKRFFSSSIESNTNSPLQTLTYGLMLSSIMNRLDIVESMSTYINTQIKDNYGIDTSTFDRDINGSLIPNGFGGYLYSVKPFLIGQEYITSPYKGLVLQGAEYQQDVNSIPYYVVSRYNYQLIAYLDKALVYIPEIKKLSLASYSSYIDKVEELDSFYGMAACLCSKQVSDIIDIPYKSIYSVRFDFWQLFSRAISTLPKDYDWFSLKALNKNSNIGGILYSILIPVAAVYRAIIEVLNSSYTNSSTYYINRKLQDFSLPIIPNLSKEEKYQLLRTYLSFGSCTKENITAVLRTLFPQEIKFHDFYKEIFSFNSDRNIFNSLLGVGYFQGNKYNTNVVQIDLHRPINDVIRGYINAYKPAGTELFINQVIDFTADLSTPKAECFEIGLGECPCIMVLGNVCFLTEQGDCVTLEKCPEDNTYYVLQAEADANPLDYVLTESEEYIISEI